MELWAGGRVGWSGEAQRLMGGLAENKWNSKWVSGSWRSGTTRWVSGGVARLAAAVT